MCKAKEPEMVITTSHTWQPAEPGWPDAQEPPVMRRPVIRYKVVTRDGATPEMIAETRYYFMAALLAIHRGLKKPTKELPPRPEYPPTEYGASRVTVWGDLDVWVAQAGGGKGAMMTIGFNKATEFSSAQGIIDQFWIHIEGVFARFADQPPPANEQHNKNGRPPRSAPPAASPDYNIEDFYTVLESHISWTRLQFLKRAGFESSDELMRHYPTYEGLTSMTLELAISAGVQFFFDRLELRGGAFCADIGFGFLTINKLDLKLFGLEADDFEGTQEIDLDDTWVCRANAGVATDICLDEITKAFKKKK